MKWITGLVSITSLSVFVAAAVAPQIKLSPFITFQQVPSYLYPHWKAYGDHIAKAGTERIVGTGTIVRRLTPTASLPLPVAVSLFIEFPGKVRIDEGGKAAALFDEDVTRSGAVTEDIGDLLELLVEDFSDGFFRTLTTDGTSRWIGVNFQSSEQPKVLYDIAELRFITKVRGTGVAQSKLYFFDSKTKLLAKVGYIEAKARGKVAVEAEFSDWVLVKGQALPQTLVRREDGVEMIRVQLSQLSVIAAVNDGVFGGVVK